MHTHLFLFFLLQSPTSSCSLPPVFPQSTATQLPAPLSCHNTAHTTWGDPRTEWIRLPWGGGVATSGYGVMGTTCKQRQPLALIGADKWRSDRGRSDGSGRPIAVETELCFYRPCIPECSAINRGFVQKKHSTHRSPAALSLHRSRSTPAWIHMAPHPWPKIFFFTVSTEQLSLLWSTLLSWKVLLGVGECNCTLLKKSL